jgi:diaminohydroxyphosphoribosylaminopyrimidine deaminase/5-amino-6-(5-phosphoribosylamino)uracil reductase
MTDEQYMKLALALAESARGQTSPNPLVGAVVVKDGQIVGMGAHLKAGEPHAEVHAIRMAGEKAKGATAYVTLEPCSHYGKTPPCADLLIEAGVARVVIATEDPFPKVSGRGIRKLQQVGIEVEVGICKQEALDLNRIFFHFVRTKRPYVTIKSATTLDGKTATVQGNSKWITSEQAREDVHRYRHEHDAILVGVGTVLADNPSLTTRLAAGGLNPVRVILDRRLRTPLDRNVITDGKAPTWIFTEERADKAKKKALEEKGVQVFSLPNVSVEAVLETLREKNILSVFVEGGATVNGSFVKAGTVDQVITYLAPKIFGGAAAPTAIGGDGVFAVADALPFEVQEVIQIGSDVKIVARAKEDGNDVYGNY